MVMTDVSGFKERADALGKLGVSYGVGMVIGKKGLWMTLFGRDLVLVRVCSW